MRSDQRNEGVGGRQRARARVLIVDDDPVARKLARDALRLSGEQWDTWEADDGRSALNLIRALKPDVVLLDITMPEVGGIPVCTEIKSDPATRGTEIIIVSARAEGDFIAAGMAAGARDYLTKPFQPAELVRRVRRIMEARAGLGHSAPTDAAEAGPGPARSDVDGSA